MMARVRSRRFFLIAATGVLLTTVSVLAQGMPTPAGTGKQETISPWVDSEAIRRLAMQLKGLGGDKSDPELLKQLRDFFGKHANPTTKEQQLELAKQFLKTQPGLKDDPKKQEQFLKQLGVDLKNPPKGDLWPGLDFKGLDKTNNPPVSQLSPPQPPSLPTSPPANTNLPKPSADPPAPPTPGNAGQGDPPSTPQGMNPQAQPKTGPNVNPELMAEQQKQFLQFAGWWEQNIGPLNETPAVKQLFIELFNNSSDGGAGTFGDIFKGADTGDLPDLGGSGWKLPDLGFGSGASSTNTGFTPPSAPETGSFGGFGGGLGGGPEGSWLPVIVLVVVVGAALVAWWLWPKLVGARYGEPRPLPGLGPWPVDPRTIADREALVKAFEYVSVLFCGAGAKVWNHITIASALEQAVPQAEALADPLARLYAVARYTPANEDLPPGAIAEAREYLCELAGVRGV